MADPSGAHPRGRSQREPDLISVVVPTKGRPRELTQALRGITAQRDVDLEVIVVDDARDGTTGAVVEDLDDPRVRVIDNPGRSGAASSRNTGLEHASGRWVAFCDDDDLWSPDKLRVQLDAIAAAGAAWCCTGAVLVDPALRVLGHERPEAHRLTDLRFFNFVPAGGSGVVAAMEVVAAAGPFDETLTNSEDWDMWVRLGQQGPGAVVDHPLVAYRVWPSNKSSDVAAVARSIRRILERHGAWPPPEEFAHTWDQYFLRKLTTSGRHRDAARVAARMANRRRDLKYAVRAAALVVAPDAITAHDQRHRMAAVPPGWQADAEAWLSAFRSFEGAAGSGRTQRAPVQDPATTEVPPAGGCTA